MSYVMAAPEMMAAAATHVAAVGSTLDAAHTAAAAPTVAVAPAAADSVSTGIANLFSQVGQNYQGLAGQAATFHAQFVQQLTAASGSYATTESAAAASLASEAGSSVNTVVGLAGPAIAGYWSFVADRFFGLLTELTYIARLAFAIAYNALFLTWLTLSFFVLSLARAFGIMIPPSVLGI